MKKTSTVQTFKSEILKEQKLTIGVDLGDRWSFYCVLDEAGKIILEQKVPTTPEAMKQTFSRMPQSRIALETGTHSPWASQLLTELEHEVIVAHAARRNSAWATVDARNTAAIQASKGLPTIVRSQVGDFSANGRFVIASTSVSDVVDGPL